VIRKQIELKTISTFVDAVNALAERKMEQTGKLEGSHYAAMQLELAGRKAEATCPTCGQIDADPMLENQCPTCGYTRVAVEVKPDFEHLATEAISLGTLMFDPENHPPQFSEQEAFDKFLELRERLKRRPIDA